MLRALLSAAIFITAITSSAIASAQTAPQPRPVDEEAHGYFMAARAAYQAGRYEDALDLFERSYRVSALPELLYNIGQAADRLRRDERVIEAFSQYLEQLPNAPNRPEVENRLRVLRAALEARRAQDAEARATLAAPTSPTPTAAPEPNAPERAAAPTDVPSAAPPEALSSTPAPTPSASEDLTWLWVTLGAVLAVGVGVAVAVPLATQTSSIEVVPAVPGDVGPGGLVIALGSL